MLFVQFAKKINQSKMFENCRLNVDCECHYEGGNIDCCIICNGESENEL